MKSKIKITEDNIVDYLLTLQLLIAGYHITYDEIIEQYAVYSKLNTDWRWYDDYSYTTEQQNLWYKEANPIVRKLYHCNKNYATRMLQWFNLQYGISIINI